MTATNRKFGWTRSLAVIAAPIVVAGGANAAVELRVESRPDSGPIEAYVRVSDGFGTVSGLTASDFDVTLDGAPLSTFSVGLPPDQDSAQRISVVIINRSIGSAAGVVTALTDFIGQMSMGDYAAIVAFQTRLPEHEGAKVHAFTAIDGGGGSDSLITFLSEFSPSGYSGLFDAMTNAVDQFATPSVTLPKGPKAIILVDNGFRGTASATQSDVLAQVNAIGIPVFAIQTGATATDPELTARMRSFAADTGGTYFSAPDEVSVGQAMNKLAALLDDAYRLTIPQTVATDCDPHMLEITARGESTSMAFTRCDTTPERLEFEFREGISPGAMVVSNTVTIESIDSPVEISVIDGEYSIGCTGSFTSVPGIILPGNQLCVRHEAPTTFSTVSPSTVLITGGVASFFGSSTANEPLPPPSGGGGSGGSGGGGSTGVLELLLLAMLFARRYFCRTYSPGASPSGG
jgi:hypothetical protein